MTGFIKYMRSEEAEFLLKYPNANHLFMVMAFRARRTDHPMNGLKAGQCFLGDYSSIGMTERQYRTAKKQLSDWNLATFKGTNKGTVGTILNTRVYDINEELRDEQEVTKETSKRRASDEQATTNKESNNVKNKESLDWSALQMSEQEIKEIKQLRRNAKAVVTQRVINDLSKQFEKSRARGYTNEDILLEWSTKGWRSYKDEWMKAPLRKQVTKYAPQNARTEDQIKSDWDLL
tara:strand:- start:4325 stop:5026 length:702 start_codon:yes stop_codon:yes gene_type:complete